MSVSNAIGHTYCEPTASKEGQRRAFDVFYIRSGWRTAVSEAVEANMPEVASMLRDHRLFVLNEQQVRDYVKLHPTLVASVPILMVIDRVAASQNLKTGYGFRLCLGVIKNPETAVSLLKWGVQLALMSRADLITRAVRKSGHKESLAGMIELLGEGTSHLTEL
jgi:hypothetical protein